MIKNFSSCRSVALFSCPQSLNKGWSLMWNKLPGLQVCKSKFLYLCVTVCVHLLPQKFSAHWHFKSNITGYRYKRSLWIGVFVVKSYHELLLSIMEFDKLINNCDHCVLYFCFFVCFLIAIFAIVFFSSSSSLWTSSWIVTVTSQTKQ